MIIKKPQFTLLLLSIGLQGHIHAMEQNSEQINTIPNISNIPDILSRLTYGDESKKNDAEKLLSVMKEKIEETLQKDSLSDSNEELKTRLTILENIFYHHITYRDNSPR